MVTQSARETLAQAYEASARIFADRGNSFLARANRDTAALIRAGQQDDRHAFRTA